MGAMTTNWPAEGIPGSTARSESTRWWTNTWSGEFRSDGFTWQLAKIAMEDNAIIEEWHREDVTSQAISSS